MGFYVTPGSDTSDERTKNAKIWYNLLKDKEKPSLSEGIQGARTEITTVTNSKELSFIRYYQAGENLWSNESYAGSTIGYSGCGACSLAMAVAGLKQDPSVTPKTIRDLLVSNGIHTVNNGRKCAELVASTYGLTFERISLNKKDIDNALNSGKVLVFSCDNISFEGQTIWKEGHYILCYAHDNNDKYYVIQSSTNGYRTDQPYDYSVVFQDLNQGIFVLGE